MTQRRKKPTEQNAKPSVDEPETLIQNKNAQEIEKLDAFRSSAFGKWLEGK